MRIAGAGRTISTAGDSSDLKFALGVLLSRLGAWYLRTKYAIYDTLYPWYTKKQLAAFPMKPKSARVVALVERMLELNKQKHSGKLAPSELERVEREIAATDAEIDNLVYELYGIADEERKIIEGMGECRSVVEQRVAVEITSHDNVKRPP
jgi:hypothetical protein